jgi:ADP-ribosylglycohydrolase
MEQMLIEAGDTDTNAAIVGGLIGAAHGFKSLPDDWVEAVFKLNSDDIGRRNGRDRDFVPYY